MNIGESVPNVEVFIDDTRVPFVISCCDLLLDSAPFLRSDIGEPALADENGQMSIAN